MTIYTYYAWDIVYKSEAWRCCESLRLCPADLTQAEFVLKQCVSLSENAAAATTTTTTTTLLLLITVTF
jgi:hypothetical protein